MFGTETILVILETFNVIKIRRQLVKNNLFPKMFKQPIKGILADNCHIMSSHLFIYWNYLAILYLSGNIPVFITWFVKNVKEFFIAGSINFRGSVEISSNPQLFLLEGLFIVFPSTYLSVKTVLNRLFRKCK